MVVAEGTEIQYTFLRRNVGDLIVWLDIKNKRERTVRNNSMFWPDQLGGLSRADRKTPEEDCICILGGE